MALKEVNLSASGSWDSFEDRLTDEHQAFVAAKKQYILDEKKKMAKRLAQAQGVIQREQENKERKDLLARQRVKRYDNGDKYDGEVRLEKTTSIPHGHVRLSFYGSPRSS